MTTPGPSRVRVLLFAAAAAAAAAGLGTAVVVEPGVTLPLTLELVVLAGLTWAVLARVRDRARRRWLTGLVAGALALRLGALVVVHVALNPAFFAPDAATYHFGGTRLLEFWQGVAPYPFEASWQVAYHYLNGFFTWLFGDPTFGAVTLNLFAGVWTAMLAYLLGAETLGERVGRVAGVLVAVFPSMVLWSVLNVRDALATLLVTLAVYLGVRVYRRFRPGSLVLLLLTLLLLTGFRDYMGFLVLVGLIVGYAAALRRGRIASGLAVGGVLAFFLVFAADRLGFFERVLVDNPLETASRLREGLMGDFGGGLAGSAFGLEHDTSTLGGALRFLPVGLAYLLFAPFPWRITSTLQLTTFPEVLLWYALFPFTLWGMRHVFDERGRAAVPLLAVLLVVVLSYALVEGNVGAAYRHRAQVMPLLFVFSAAGLMDARVRWLERRRRRMMRRVGARQSLRGEAAPT